MLSPRKPEPVGNGCRAAPESRTKSGRKNIEELPGNLFPAPEGKKRRAETAEGKPLSRVAEGCAGLRPGIFKA
jgi:hypothetical protein